MFLSDSTRSVSMSRSARVVSHSAFAFVHVASPFEAEVSRPRSPQPQLLVVVVAALALVLLSKLAMTFDVGEMHARLLRLCSAVRVSVRAWESEDTSQWHWSGTATATVGGREPETALRFRGPGGVWCAPPPPSPPLSRRCCCCLSSACVRFRTIDAVRFPSLSQQQRVLLRCERAPVDVRRQVLLPPLLTLLR